MHKNSAFRLRRVRKNLETAQDALHMANGYLYLDALRSYRDELDRIIKAVAKFEERLERDIPAAKGGRPPKDDEDAAA